MLARGVKREATRVGGKFDEEGRNVNEDKTCGEVMGLVDASCRAGIWYGCLIPIFIFD